MSRIRVELFSALTDKTLSDPPIVVDANAKIYEMQNLQGERGGVWIMLNPTGQMPISFTLAPRKESGIEAARAPITSCKYLGHDLDEVRKTLHCERITQASNMVEIMRIIDEIPEREQIE